MVPGFASSVISTSGANAIRCRNASNKRAKSSGGNKLGVPPPKNTVSIMRSSMARQLVSKSRMQRVDVGASGGADFN